ncbi:tRNA epoxyqueuosine(34) reductase QueG [Clostridiaceae bacterium M8S5]|nr:tRNA epoxyqueuosine(34) reductase QueG [Clostridiaceae bacterium M8S5]
MNIKDYITNIAQELNIDIIGFGSTKPFDDVKEVLKHRRDKNYSCDLESLDIEKRCNPKMHLDNAKSFITIGISYNVKSKPKPLELSGKLSKTSWGIDYHNVLKAKLKQLASKLKELVDYNYKIVVDTSELIDREVAVRSDIGWYGKNCSVINDKYGSFIFIGYLITDIDLGVKDITNHSKCGECNKCVLACPTGALNEGYEFDANKCISYLTQTKKDIPYELRDKMGISIYGCDICQEACPYNLHAVISEHDEFIPKKTLGFIDLKEIINMSKQEFNQKYSEMSGSWRGRNVLRRNSVIALGNIGSKKSLDILKETLNDPSPTIRKYTAYSILKTDDLQGRELLREHLRFENDESVREEILKLLLR